MTYADTYARWQSDPETFWLDAARAIDWVTPPARALNDSRAPLYEWFTDTQVNACWNALDRHVQAGRGGQTAIIHDSPLTGTISRISYAEMLARTATFAGALAARGVGKGDRVVIYMPMVPEALVAMLACARLGAIHSVVFGGFAAAELAVRIDDSRPKAVIAASCGIEPARIVPYKPLLDQAIAMAAHKPDFCVILQRPQGPCTMVPGRDHDWQAFTAGAPEAPCTPVEGNHPAYILYTSGTTGQPKGVVRPTAGHLVALHWSMRAVYDVGQGDVFWAASDVGWVVGHSYICYGPLVAGCTSVMFEGKPVGTPDAGTYWRVIAEHRVRSFFTAPTALRAIKREDPGGAIPADYDLSCLKVLYLAGERADPDTIRWAEKALGIPVIDHWWQTELGWPCVANPVGIERLPVRIGSPSVVLPGYDLQVLDEDGTPLPPDTLGAIALRLPLPPGTLPTLWNAEDRFRKAYLARFPGYYETGDAGYKDADGYVYIMARTDDVINVAGHRLSTGAMEEVLASHPDVAECAVIGIADDLKGQVPLGFVCLNKGAATAHADVVAGCVNLVRDRIGPVADFKRALVVDRLPKTRSGKILRATMAKIAAGETPKVPATIDDPAILDEIRAALQAAGLVRG
jgi:propionyl-CoA synthetase